MNRKARLASYLALWVAAFSSVAVAQGPSLVWKKVGGNAVDISSSLTPDANFTATVIVAATDGELYIFKDGGFMPQSGVMMKCIRVDVAPDHQPWCVTPQGDIQRQVVVPTRAGIPQTSWPMVAGPKAKDLGVGPNDALWIIGADSKIHRRRGANWEVVPGKAERIDVDKDGNAWIVDAQGAVFRFQGTGFQRVPGILAVDIGIGGSGAVYVASKDGFAYKWKGTLDVNAWAKTDGRLVSVTADSRGIPLGTNAKRETYFSEVGPTSFRLNIVTRGNGKVRLSDNDKDCSKGCNITTSEKTISFYWDGKEGSFERWEGGGPHCMTQWGPAKGCTRSAGDTSTITAVFKE